MKKVRLFAILLAALTVLLIVLTGCGGANENGQIYFSLDDLKAPGKTFSLWQGCGYEDYLHEYFPDAKADFGLYVSDLSLKVRQNKTDAMVIGESFFNFFNSELSDMVMLDEDLGTIQGALIFSRGDVGSALLTAFNQFVAESYQDGTIDRLKEKWLGLSGSSATLDMNGLDPSWEHIRVGLAEDEPPYAFLKGGSIAGYDAELVKEFCLSKHFYPDITYADYEALVTSVQTDRFDMIGAGYEIVEEREENVSYSDATREDRVVVVVKGAKQKTSFVESVRKSFRRTFLDEERYKQFASGIAVTMIIVMASVLIGFFLGFLIYFFRRDGGKVAEKVISVLSVILHRVPSIVLLMVLYYVVFGKVNIDAVIVAIILFTLSFGISTYESIDLAVGSIGKGQLEAAFTLGLTKNESFFRILFPQGRRIFMSGVKDSIVSIMLESSVVGYITVSDLTRVGDIIRNNTYEAFFPLIAVAVFYLLLSSLIIAVINHVEKRKDPKNRSKEIILKTIAGK